MSVNDAAPIGGAAGTPAQGGQAAVAGAPGAPAGGTDTTGNALAGTLPLADRVDIQILDLTAALQIVMAEVRAELELSVETAPAQNPARAANALIQMFLQAAGSDDPPAGTDAAAGTLAPMAAGADSQTGAADASAQVELAFRAAIDRAVETVAGWRNVTAAVIDAAKQTRALVVSQLSDEPPSPAWLRPEWMGLAPRMERYWRRRKARRRLTDPDPRGARDSGTARAAHVAEQTLPKVDDRS